MSETEPPVLTNEQFESFLKTWNSMDQTLRLHMLKGLEYGEPLMKQFFERAYIFTTFPSPDGPDSPYDGEGDAPPEVQAELDRLNEKIKRRRAAGEEI